MSVTRKDILIRGLLQRCPNCGGKTVFRGLFKTNERCARCGFLILREEGFFLGAMALNYAAGAFPLVVLFMLVFMEKISVPLAMGLLIGWSILVPVLFYRTSRALWLMLVYLCVPHLLPANDTDPAARKEHF